MTNQQKKAEQKAKQYCSHNEFTDVQVEIFLLVKQDYSYWEIGNNPAVNKTEKQVGKQVELMLAKVNKNLKPDERKVYSMFGMYEKFGVYKF